MAHHQHSDYDRRHQGQSSLGTRQSSELSQLPTGEDEINAELDEPPDDLVRFAPLPPVKVSSAGKKPSMTLSSMPHNRNASLLTQALLLSPNLTPNSDAEAPVLTTDGDLTSPARTTSPSPPLLASQSQDLAGINPYELSTLADKAPRRHVKLPPSAEATDSSAATDLEVGLGRKRCIKFACGRQAAAQPDTSQPAATLNTKVEAPEPREPAARPCMLRFVCPMKPPKPSESRHISEHKSKPILPERHPSTARELSPTSSPDPQHQDSRPGPKMPVTEGRSDSPEIKRLQKSLIFSRPNLEASEATRFHEFAGPYDEDDDWIHEQTAYRKKMTINDTLQKENAIRKIGEEAEEEALEEEAVDEAEEVYNDPDDASYDPSTGDHVSDAGNETDDEDGFAESDDDSEIDSEYQFWTPGLTTAATSADHLEHARFHVPRTSSDSSIESKIHLKDSGPRPEPRAKRIRESNRTQPVMMRPTTPDLPDSTDFVCGTLDEDRPLEAAYMSCLEERRRFKHRIIPQDIDPSFPTSDPEVGKNDEASCASTQASDEPLWVLGFPENSDEEHAVLRRQPLSRRNTKSPMPSPKRMRSPPPKRSHIHRSPPPRAATCHTHEEHSSASSPISWDDLQPAASRSSPSPPITSSQRMMTPPPLPERGNVTSTASLPRTPNPFWAPRGPLGRLASVTSSPKGTGPDMRSRGPIDIVTGLEKKRQRRKEKFWRQHCRNGAKEKERRCQPGKGAERMRELGLEMAGKNKGYLPQAQLMLSI
ncbi:MAG: hypothetical protein Q9222_003214 [Ikaeria aurantiellina]